MISLEPLPHAEAVALLKGKPAVAASVFRDMIPEIRARAFAVGGLEDLAVAQRVRDRISDLARGAANWAEVRSEVAENISSLLVTSKDPEEREKQTAAAYRKAELVVRTQTFQAYQAASHRIMEATRASFPYWQYRTMEDGAVREAHAALDGIVLPADSPFWRDHFPPWDWGCRCQVIPLSESDVAELREEERDLPAEDRHVLSPPAQRRIEAGELYRGRIPVIDPNDPDRKRVVKYLPPGRYDVGSPLAHAASPEERAAVWQWIPGDLHFPLEQLRERYAPEVWAVFARSMQDARLVMAAGGGGAAPGPANVWDWLLDPARDAAGGSARALLRQSGKEYLTALDYNTGGILAVKEGAKGTVPIGPAIQAARREGTRVSLVHAHAKAGPSPRDLGALVTNPEVKEVLVYTPTGRHQVTLARMSEAGRDKFGRHLRGLQQDWQSGRMSALEWERKLVGFQKRGVIRHVIRSR